MSERTERFEISGSPRLMLRVPAGEVRVVTGPSGEVVVRCRSSEHESRIIIEGRGDTVTVEPERIGWGRWASVDLEIAVGAAPEVRARLASANLVVDAAARSLDASSASGSVTAGVVEGPVTARLASGDLAVSSVGGRFDVVTASGEIRAGAVGGMVDIKAASGDVSLGVVEGDASVRTASGDVTISRFEGGRLEAKTISGGVRVGVPSGRRYSVSLQSLSGEVRTDFPVSGDDCSSPARLAVGSISGDIRISAAGEG